MTDPLPAEISSRRDPPDPIAFPYYYQGITAKRIFAYFIDIVAIGLIGLFAWLILVVAGLVTFGLLWPLIPVVTLLIPLAYHVLQVAGHNSSTIGMRFMGIEVVSLVGPPKPSLVQAFILTVLFYITVYPTSFIVLVVTLFNPYRRALHDYLSGTIVLNRVRPSPS